MKRDMDLIRAILVMLYERDDFDGSGAYILNDEPELLDAGFTAGQVDYHVRLLNDAGLIDTGRYSDLVRRLTWDGTEFIEAMKQDTIWNKVMDRVGGSSSGVSFAVLTNLAVEYAKQQVGL